MLRVGLNASPQLSETVFVPDASIKAKIDLDFDPPAEGRVPQCLSLDLTTNGRGQGGPTGKAVSCQRLGITHFRSIRQATKSFTRTVSANIGIRLS